MTGVTAEQAKQIWKLSVEHAECDACYLQLRRYREHYQLRDKVKLMIGAR